MVVNSVTHKVMISDTTLRLFITPQVRKTTSKLRQIHGCDICIIPKDTQIDLDISRTRLVTDLQQTSVGRQIFNISFSNTRGANNKDAVFPDGECLHATIKDAAKCITYIPVKPNNMINIKCDFGFVTNVLSSISPMNN